MAAVNKDKKSAILPLYANAYDYSKALLELIDKSPLLQPVATLLAALIEDPILKQTLQDSPPADPAHMSPERYN